MRVALDYLWLTKPRIEVVLLLTALGAVTVAAGRFPPARLTMETLAELALSAGEAHALKCGTTGTAIR